MPAIKIDTCYLKEILEKMPDLPPHNWLISGLECYDCCGWDGSEKWAEYELFLTDEQLKKDVNLRNMQIIWGVFSAVPVTYTKEEVYACELPDVESPRYMSNHIVPQNTLAVLEIYVDDGSFMIISARNAAFLEPFHDLPYEIRDEEKDNQAMNAILRRIQDKLREMNPDVDPQLANEVQWKCWHALFYQNTEAVGDTKLCTTIEKLYGQVCEPEYRCFYTFWDPYAQK